MRSHTFFPPCPPRGGGSKPPPPMKAIKMKSQVCHVGCFFQESMDKKPISEEKPGKILPWTQISFWGPKWQKIAHKS